MSSWHTYPSIYNVGHKVIQDFFNHEVQVEEKVDGSQFSFGKFHTEDTVVDEDGVEHNYILRVKSKNNEFPVATPNDLFKQAADTVKRLGPKLHEGWTYRGEVLQKPKHTALAYNRVPAGNIILFDINTDEEAYLPYEALKVEAERLGLEVVPRIYQGMVDDVEMFRSFLQRESVLGGVTIEGVVCKPLARDLFGRDKKLLMAKFVSEAYKEVHKKAWGESNPSQNMILRRLIAMYATKPRWDKAIQHLRDDGLLENRPQDIPLVLKEVAHDITTECQEEIKDLLWRHFEKDLKRGWVKGLPEHYKQRLLEEQFKEGGKDEHHRLTDDGASLVVEAEPVGALAPAGDTRGRAVDENDG